jgi:GTP-binding protein Era
MKRCGTLALIGRPNVGKSTLTNGLAGAKLCIVSNKAQTTRHPVRAILTQTRGENACQFIFVDTPGFQTQHRNALNRALNHELQAAIGTVDIILLVVEACRWGQEEDNILRALSAETGQQVVVVINKIDRLHNKNDLLPFMSQLATRGSFAAIVPVSAQHNDGLEHLLSVIAPLLPAGEHRYAPDDITDRSERFLAAEFLREKLFRQLGEELPYGLTVDIEKFEQEGLLRRIYAAIIVGRAAHKAMVIGQNGERLRRIAAAARRDMEKLFGGKVWLETWVKVEKGWPDDHRALQRLGYTP